MNNLMVHVIQNNAELKYLNWTDYAENPEQATKEFWSYFKPYISVAKDCGLSHSGDCFYANKVMSLSGKSTISATVNSYYVFFKDGSFMFITPNDGHCTKRGGDNSINGCGWIIYDVNGKKAPNTLGKDVFHFYIFSNEIRPVVTNDCNKKSTGWSCADYILQNDNMDYLK